MPRQQSRDVLEKAHFDLGDVAIGVVVWAEDIIVQNVRIHVENCVVPGRARRHKQYSKGLDSCGAHEATRVVIAQRSK